MLRYATEQVGVHTIGGLFILPGTIEGYFVAGAWDGRRALCEAFREACLRGYNMCITQIDSLYQLWGRQEFEYRTHRNQ